MSVNKINVGDLQPTGSMSGLAAQALANRRGSGGGGVVTTPPNVPQGLQGAMPGVRQAPGAGKQWQQEQQEKAVVEQHLITARNNAARKEQELRAQLAQAVRDGRRDFEAQIRGKLSDLSDEQTTIETGLTKHTYMDKALHKYFTDASVVNLDPESGTKMTMAGPMLEQVHQAFKNSQEIKLETRRAVSQATEKALLYSIGMLNERVAMADTPMEKEKRAAGDGFTSVIGMPVPARLMGAVVGKMDKAISPYDYEDRAAALREEAAGGAQWVDGFARSFSESLASSHGQKTVEMTAPVSQFMRSLFGLTMVGDDRELAKGHAKNAGRAIKQMKSMGVTDLEIDALRDHLVEAGQSMRMSSSVAMAEDAATETTDAKEESRVNAFSKLKGVGTPEMNRIADSLVRMGSELDVLSTHIGEDGWDPEYAVKNFSELKGSPDWLANAIPQFTAEFLAKGELSEEQVTNIKHQFDAETWKEVLGIIQNQYAQRAQVMRNEVAGAGYDPDELFGVDHAAKKRELEQQRNNLVRRLSDLEFEAEGELNRLGDAASDKMFDLMDSTAEDIAAVDAELAGLSVMTDPTIDQIAMMKDELGNKP